MKTIVTILLLVLSAPVIAQNYQVANIKITLPANLNANTAKWANNPSALNIKATVRGRGDAFVQESKLLVNIKRNGNKVYGSYNSKTAPASGYHSFDKFWNGKDVVALLGKGYILPPGEYELSVQFFGFMGTTIFPLSREVTKTFSIKADKQQIYQARKALVPVSTKLMASTKEDTTVKDD